MAPSHWPKKQKARINDVVRNLVQEHPEPKDWIEVAEVSPCDIVLAAGFARNKLNDDAKSKAT